MNKHKILKKCIRKLTKNKSNKDLNNPMIINQVTI